MKLHLASLGCARNQVDSEMMLGRFRARGWEITKEPDEAEVIVVNTCSFIEAAANESIDTILTLATCKRTGACKRLIVTGCLPERYREPIVDSLPEVDLFLGTGSYDQIEKGIENLFGKERCILADPNRTALTTAHLPRMISESHIAYLKLAEGCSSRCSYCIIPKLRGNHRSRTVQDITSEALKLIKSGVRELVLVAQDTTHFGKDLIPASDLNHLLLKISDLSENIWIRVLYAHPNRMDKELIKTIATRPNICSYFDIPIQHASDSVLRRMGRHYTREDLYRLFEMIRETAPDASLRTTTIVGFPGETENDVRTLLELVERIRFDHLGVFTYSDSDDLPSHRLPNHVPAKVAQARYDHIMSRQLEISRENNQKFLGRILTVLVEESPENHLSAGRHAGQAPEVDGMTFIHEKSELGTLPIGGFTRVRIIDTWEYDLVGEIIET